MVEILNPWAICLGCEQLPVSEPIELKRYKFMVDGCERIDVYEDDKGEWIHDPDHEIQVQSPTSEPDDAFWESINRETGKDLLDIVYGLLNGLITPNQALDAISERCFAVYRLAIGQ